MSKSSSHGSKNVILETLYPIRSGFQVSSMVSRSWYQEYFLTRASRLFGFGGVYSSVKPRLHQLQCRSNIVECYKVQCCFDKVERCFDIVAKNGIFVAGVDRALEDEILSGFQPLSDELMSLSQVVRPQSAWDRPGLLLLRSLDPSFDCLIS